MSRVPITLMAKRATLRDLGSAYWIHKNESNWMANICQEGGRQKRISNNVTDCFVPSIRSSSCNLQVIKYSLFYQ